MDLPKVTRLISETWDLKPTPLSRGRLPDLRALESQEPLPEQSVGKTEDGGRARWYLAAGSTGNS